MAKKPKSPTGQSKVIQGVAASPGVAVGGAYLLRDVTPAVRERKLSLGEIDQEIARFQEAIETSRLELEVIRRGAAADLGEEEARIFDVQLMILEDPMVVDKTIEAIKKERLNAEVLFVRHVGAISEHLESISDQFFSERSADLQDVKRRVLMRLSGTEGALLPSRASVLMGRDLSPSEAVLLDPKRVLGFVTDAGGVTSHASIMARARGIPAVVGARSVTRDVQPGDTVAVDGITGKVTVNPSSAVLEKIKQRRRAFVRLQRRRERTAGGEARTRDDRRIFMMGNMETPDELDSIVSRGAEGIGLFRTEFFFMRHHRPPTEDEQIQCYQEVADGLAGKELVIRVLDVGGDKFASYLGLPSDNNPYFGLRGIRYLLAHQDLFETQIRAILRAGARRNIKMLLPMVNSVDEVTQSRNLVKNLSRDLSKQGIPHADSLEIGVMVEVPSVVMAAEQFVEHADFLSIGSNDLIQFLLAVDRQHAGMHDSYEPLHPGVIHALDKVITAARGRKQISICGEMAGDPEAVPILIGLGLTQLSLSPFLIPEIKQIVRDLRYADCRVLADEAMAAGTAAEVRRLIAERLGSTYSSLARMRQESNGGSGR